MQGAWKDLLFAILINFSHEIAPIAKHDESRAFTPEAVEAMTPLLAPGD